MTKLVLIIALAVAACVPSKIDINYGDTPTRRGALGGIPGGGFVPPTKIGSGGGGGGDITSVGVTAPIAGGGTSGAVNLSLGLCAASQILKMNGGATAWACAADAGGFDTAGTGLTSSGTTVNVIGGSGITANANDVAIDPTYTQRRVGGTCSAGSSIRTVNQDGTVVCETDDDTNTTYTAGTGLSLTTTVFSLGLCGTDGMVWRRVAGVMACAADLDTNTLGPDGDKGDVTVGGTGTTLTVDNGSMTSAKLNITTTSCSAGQHVSAIGSGGVGSCTADAADKTQSISGGSLTALAVNSDSTLVYWTPSGSGTLEGIANGAAGRRFKLVITTGDIITIAYNGSGAAAGNKVTTSDGYNWRVRGPADVDFTYDATASLWIANPGVTRVPRLDSDTSLNATTNIGAGGYLETGGGVYASSNSAVLINGGLYFGYSTNGTYTGRINAVGYNEGNTQKRSIGIYDGTCTNTTTCVDSTDRIAFFDGTNRATILDGALTIAGITTANGNTVLGDADADTVNSRARMGFSGTDVSVASGNCSASGEAQDFQITSVGDMSSCVVNLNRTFTAGRCTAWATTSGAGATVANPGLYGSATVTTQWTIATVSGTMATGNSFNVHCFDDLD